MNKDLRSEELDRELIVRHREWTTNDGKTIDCNTRARISKKTLTFVEAGGEEKSITFTKRHSQHFGETLEIESRRNEIVYKRCDLGHNHEVSKKERVYKWWTLEWEHVQGFIDWLSAGSWSEVSGKERSYVKVMKEAEELLKELEQKEANKLFKPQIQKVRNKLRGFG